MASKFTVVALHTSMPRCIQADEITLSAADLDSVLRSNHGVLPHRFQSMTLRAQDGTESRVWFSWRADSRRYGTDWCIDTASGVNLLTIKMPGFWYSGTAPR
jgi:hypothetical protein